MEKIVEEEQNLSKLYALDENDKWVDNGTGFTFIKAS